MARPRLGLIQHIAGDLYIQIRADSMANKAIAKMVDDALSGKDNEKVLWFDKGAEVIAERKPVSGGVIG